jgi:N-acetylmuramate 1-kinase
MEPHSASPLAAELRDWLAACGFAQAGQAGDAGQAADLAIEPLPGDVSPRRYARLAPAAGPSAILATYPPEARAVCPRFLATTRLLEAAGVRVPRVLAADCERGFMLLEDLGPRTLAERRHLPWSELAGFFDDALAQAARIAALPKAEVAGLNPPLGRALLERELTQTRDAFLVPRGLAGEGELAAELAALLAEICARLAAEEPVPCHRDFMARNLIPLAPCVADAGDTGEPRRAAGAHANEHARDAPGHAPRVGVLDHQDLRLGPPAYDLASLLNDTLFPPPEVERELLRRAAPSRPERERYHRAAAQRTLKAVGTYAAFARRGVDRHLPLIPPTLGRALGHLARTPEGAGLAPRLAARWSHVLGPLPHYLLD